MLFNTLRTTVYIHLEAVCAMVYTSFLSRSKYAKEINFKADNYVYFSTGAFASGFDWTSGKAQVVDRTKVVPWKNI